MKTHSLHIIKKKTKLLLWLLSERFSQVLPYFATFTFIMLSLTSFAQEEDLFEKQKKQFEQAYKKQNQTFDETQKSQNDKYRTFKQKLDKKFGEYLRKSSWTKKTNESPKVAKTAPKPLDTPVAKPEDKKPTQTKIEVIRPQNLPTSNPNSQNIPKITKIDINPKTAPSQQNTFSINFFEREVKLLYDEDWKIDLLGSINEKSIAEYWEKMSQKDYIFFLQQTWRYRENMQLNDWAYYQLLKNISETINGKATPESRLFTWFMLSQSGYKVKIGYASDVVHVLLASSTLIYRNPYYKFENIYYYIMDAPPHRIYLSIHNKDYPEAKNLMNLDMEDDLIIADRKATRVLSFTHRSKKYDIEIDYNVSSVDFMKVYPLSDIRVFFKAKPSAIVQASIEDKIAPLLKGMPEREAVDLLLSLVQKGFAYKTDGEQFGTEKTLFIDEIFFYPYSDCEDRSVFFAYLVKNLLGLKVIALDYPQHIATAVSFSESISGDFVMYKGEKYIVCDPTYIGASSGRAMMKFEGVTPKAIDID